MSDRNTGQTSLNFFLLEWPVTNLSFNRPKTNIQVGFWPMYRQKIFLDVLSVSYFNVNPLIKWVIMYHSYILLSPIDRWRNVNPPVPTPYLFKLRVTSPRLSVICQTELRSPMFRPPPLFSLEEKRTWISLRVRDSVIKGLELSRTSLS